MEFLFNLDKYIFDIIEGSGFTLIIILGILKIIAKETTWSGDDKIISMLLGMVNANKKVLKKS